MHLDDYINEIEIKKNMIDSALVLARDAPNIKDVYVLCESIKHLNGIKGFNGFKKEVFKKIKSLSENIDKDSLVFASETMACFNKKIDNDMDNLDIKAKVVIGYRALEQFDNKIMEEFYV